MGTGPKDSDSPTDATTNLSAEAEPVGGQEFTARRLMVIGIGLELVLVAVAWCSGLLGFHYSKQGWLEFFTEHWIADCLIAIAAASFLYWCLLRFERLPNRLSVSMKEVIRDLVGPLFRPLSLWQIALLSIAAGVGEELAFRWALQGGLELYMSPWVALLIASILFGLVHCVNVAYVILASLMGAVLGLMMIFSEGMLMPIVCHAVYDFIAITLISRRKEIGPESV